MKETQNYPFFSVRPHEIKFLTSWLVVFPTTALCKEGLTVSSAVYCPLNLFMKLRGILG